LYWLEDEYFFLSILDSFLLSVLQSFLSLAKEAPSKLDFDRKERILFWSGDSASLDGVGDWIAGDLQIFFFSSTPFSASELENREERLALDIQGRGWKEKR